MVDPSGVTSTTTGVGVEVVPVSFVPGDEVVSATVTPMKGEGLCEVGVGVSVVSPSAKLVVLVVMPIVTPMNGEGLCEVGVGVCESGVIAATLPAAETVEWVDVPPMEVVDEETSPVEVGIGLAMLSLEVDEVKDGDKVEEEEEELALTPKSGPITPSVILEVVVSETWDDEDSIMIAGTALEDKAVTLEVWCGLLEDAMVSRTCDEEAFLGTSVALDECETVEDDVSSIMIEEDVSGLWEDETCMEVPGIALEEDRVGIWEDSASVLGEVVASEACAEDVFVGITNAALEGEMVTADDEEVVVSGMGDEASVVLSDILARALDEAAIAEEDSDRVVDSP